MKTLMFFVMIFAIICSSMFFGGCNKPSVETQTSEPTASDSPVFIFDINELSAEDEKLLRKWAQECTLKLRRKRGKSKSVQLCGIGVNAVFIPKADPLEEILAVLSEQKVKKPLDSRICKAWLASCISEIQKIQPGSRRSDVRRALRPDGGLSPINVRAHHSKRCSFLKVIIVYDYSKSSDRNTWSDRKDDDLVTQVSIVHLGLVTMD